MQKKDSRDSLALKFPDSERGEMKQRASFLFADAEEESEPSPQSFQSLQQAIQSPTKGEKTPFSKTPRAKMGTDSEDFEVPASPRGKNDKDQKPAKMKVVGKFFLSKHRNKRYSP